MKTVKNVDWEWFREKREAIAPNFGQNRMAKMLGIDTGTLSKMIGRPPIPPKKRRPVTIDEAIDIAIILRVSLADVLKHLGHDLRGVTTRKQSEGMAPAVRDRLIRKRMNERAPEEAE